MQIINITIDSIQKINKILTYKTYEKIKKINIEKKSIKIDEYKDKDIFQKEYDTYREVKKNSIIIARFLIAVQTAVPNITIHNQIAICPFYSFDNDEGLIYMACIADKLKLVQFKNKTVVFDRFKEDIKKEYNEFLDFRSIKELFKKKEIYSKSISKKQGIYLFEQDDDISKSFEIIEPAKINFNYKKTSKNEILFRLRYLANNVKRIVSEFIQKAAITNTYAQSVELSCCSEIATDFIGFYEEIKRQTEYIIQNDINESYELYRYLSYYISYGSIHKVMIYDKNIFCGIYNKAIVDDEKNVSEELIKSVFEVYVDEGYHIGTVREYVNDIDIKTGKKRSDIINKKYSIEKYNELLKAIEGKNIKIVKPPRDLVFDKETLNDLKNTSNNDLNNQIKILMNNMTIALGKDNEFKNTYSELFKNFGNFYKKKDKIEEVDPNIYIDKEQQKILKKKIILKNENELNNIKLNYVKTFYIDKLKKYLSKIQNYQKGQDDDDLEEKLKKIIDDDSALHDIQKEIYNNDLKLTDFFKDNMKLFFDKLELTYTNKQIDYIRGVDHIYDKEYKDIIKFSDFTSIDAYNSMLYIFVKQLNDFILCDIKTDKIILDEDLKDKTKYKLSNKCTAISRFILVLFEEIKNDVEYNSCDTSQIDNSQIHDIVNYKIKIYTKKDKVDFLSSIIQGKLEGKLSSTQIGELAEQQDIADAEVSLELDDKDERESIGMKLKQRLGRDASDDEITEYKDKHDQSNHQADEYDTYDFDEQAKGKEVLDKGHYGDEDVHDDEEFTEEKGDDW